MNDKTPVAIFLSSIFLAGFLLAGAYFIPWKGILAQTIVVTGEAKNEQQNQLATYSAGASAVNDNKQTAIDEVNKKMDAIVKALLAFGISNNDLKTQNLNVYQSEATYYEDGVQKSRPGQWRVSNTVEIKLRDVTKAQGLTDLLTTSGATNIYGPNYSLDDTGEAGNALMGKAFDNAREKALILAQASGRSLGRVVSLVEGYTPSAINYGGGGYGGGGGAQPGTNTVIKTVTVTFELR